VITRAVLVKSVVFALVSLLGVGYLLVSFLGFGSGLVGQHSYTAYLDLPNSGGIFTTASVTYRGVEVGRVGDITLRPDGIRVALNVKTKLDIPSSLTAVVADGSAIGEQYVDLRPTTDSPPYLHGGSVIEGSAASLPVNSQDVLVSVDKLVNSVPIGKLRRLVDELGTTFDNTGPTLRRMLDATNSLIQTAQTDLPKTISLLNHGGTVLDTQNDLSNDIVAFSRHLASFTDTLRSSDSDLRKLIANGDPAANQLTKAIHSIDATLPIVLNNLVSVGQVTAVRIPAIRQVLIIYPYVVATSYGLFPNNGSTRFGVPVPPSNDGPPCDVGYVKKSKRRLPTQLKYPSVRYKAFCDSPTSSGVNVRGSRMAPEPDGKLLGDEPSYQNNAGLPGGAPGDSASSVATSLGTVSKSGVSFVGPDGHQYLLGSTGGQRRVMGDQSWLWLVFGPLS